MEGIIPSSQNDKKVSGQNIDLKMPTVNIENPSNNLNNNIFIYKKNLKKMSTKKHHKNKKVDSTYTKIFKLYDEDKDGFVDFVYLAEMMRSAGAIFSDKDLERPMETIRNNNGADILTQKDFIDLCTQFVNNDETVEDLIEAFKFWDSDGSGKITVDEIRQALTTLGDVLSEDEINALIKEADPTDIGVIVIYHKNLINFSSLNIGIQLLISSLVPGTSKCFCPFEYSSAVLISAILI